MRLNHSNDWARLKGVMKLFQTLYTPIDNKTHDITLKFYAYMEHLPRRFVTDRRFVWDRAYATRQWKSHALEVSLIKPQPNESIVDAFISGQKSLLDPPQCNYPALKSFFDSASTTALSQIPPRPANAGKIALVDDRRDYTGWQAGGEHRGARDWDGYDRYPPEGVDQFFSAVAPAELYARLQVNV